MSGGVSLSFDVDGVAGLAGRRVVGGWGERLSSVSAASYGLRRGVGRVLGVLAQFDVQATFYVPGTVAQAEGALVREIAAAGHEIAHHGHAHLLTHTLDAAGERDELQRGLAALEDCLGQTPAGYRSPGWELTPVTLALLGELGFAYDSSLMGDDRPHRITAGTREIVELPVHWSLDDVPYLAFHPEHPTRLGDPAAMLAVWIAEHDLARHEDRHLTYTMHPEHTGRPHPSQLLRRLLDHIHTAHTPIHTHHHTARGS